MFAGLQAAPPDPIFDLKEQYKRDPNPDKINLIVGTYKDGEGQTPVFRAVKRAEMRILKEETTKNYLSIEGMPEYATAVQYLIFGAEHEIVQEQRAVTAHTPGGTGALRIAGEFLKRIRGNGVRVWLSDPTWPNHGPIFKASGLPVERYPYFDPQSQALAFEELISALGNIPERDIVLFHGCCHNPTGFDPTAEQWREIVEVIRRRNLFPLIDFAYQGLGSGLRDDVEGILTLCRSGSELMIASSFSKNFGLYNERVGALTVVTPTAEVAHAALGHVKKCIRSCYSNPPAHGAKIVTTVLDSPSLRAGWKREVTEMRQRIHRMRRLFVEKLEEKGVEQDFSFIESQRGMFSYSGLTSDQVQLLREEHSIYILGSGRINIAGINESNVDRLCEAIASVV